MPYEQLESPGRPGNKYPATTAAAIKLREK